MITVRASSLHFHEPKFLLCYTRQLDKAKRDTYQVIMLVFLMCLEYDMRAEHILV